MVANKPNILDFQNSRQTSNDANITWNKSGSIAFTAISAARTVTLPDPATYPSGIPLMISDESGNCSVTNKITVLAIDGTTTVATVIQPKATVILYSTGSAWVQNNLSSEQIAALVARGPIAVALASVGTGGGGGSSGASAYNGNTIGY